MKARISMGNITLEDKELLEKKGEWSSIEEKIVSKGGKPNWGQTKLLRGTTRLRSNYNIRKKPMLS